MTFLAKNENELFKSMKQNLKEATDNDIIERAKYAAVAKEALDEAVYTFESLKMSKEAAELKKISSKISKLANVHKDTNAIKGSTASVKDYEEALKKGIL